jgi:hypothetical protein
VYSSPVFLARKTFRTAHGEGVRGLDRNGKSNFGAARVASANRYAAYLPRDDQAYPVHLQPGLRRHSRRDLWHVWERRLRSDRDQRRQLGPFGNVKHPDTIITIVTARDMPLLELYRIGRTTDDPFGYLQVKLNAKGEGAAQIIAAAGSGSTRRRAG